MRDSRSRRPLESPGRIHPTSSSGRHAARRLPMEEARAVRPEELGQALTLVNKVFRTGVDQDMSTDYPLVFRPGQPGKPQGGVGGRPHLQPCGHGAAGAAGARLRASHHHDLRGGHRSGTPRAGGRQQDHGGHRRGHGGPGRRLRAAVDRARQGLLPPPGLGGGRVQRLGLPGGTPTGQTVRAAAARPRVSTRGRPGTDHRDSRGPTPPLDADPGRIPNAAGASQVGSLGGGGEGAGGRATWWLPGPTTSRG